MSYARNSHMQGGFFQDDCRHPFDKNKYNYNSSNNYRNRSWDWNSNLPRNFNHGHEFVGQFGDYNRGYPHSQPNCAPSFKRRKFSATTCGENGRHHLPSNMHYSAAPRDSSDFVPPIHHLPSNMHYSAAPRDSSDFVPPIHHLPSNMHYSAAPRDSSNFVPPPIRSNAESSVSVRNKRDRSQLEDDEPVFISRDDIERYSPSRRDGIDALHETHLRYSYCAFIQSLGLQLELPQTTIGTAMVLCHRFFVRRSHACHDRYLIATAALFLAAKSEETPRPLNNVLRASCEIFHKQDITFLSYLLPVDWFEQYRERVTEAEQMILTTLNFELNVQHPYAPLTSVLNKLGLSQTILVNLALELVSEGLRSSLWLQFKPHHIAAGAAYLAAKFLNFDLATYHGIWQEFQATPAILQDVSKQLMELF